MEDSNSTHKNRLQSENARLKAHVATVEKELESLCYSISHDLRAPLRSVIGFSRILLEDLAGQLGQEHRDYLQRIAEAGQKMTRLTEDLLSLSRLGRQPIALKEVNLSSLAHAVCDALAREHPQRKVAVTIAPDLKATGDPHMMRTLLEILFSNAFKYTDRADSPAIQFACDVHQPGSPFLIRDNGVGFDMEYTQKLFTPFQRLHPESEYPGRAIGLAMAQRIVHRHAGKIWVQAQPGKGATFFFSLEPHVD